LDRQDDFSKKGNAMCGLTRRFAVAVAIAFLIGLAGVREVHAQRRGGGGAMHSGGGTVHFGGSSFQGATGMSHSFSNGTQFFTAPQFSAGPRFFGNRGFFVQPTFFGSAPTTFSPSVSSGGSFPSYYGVPYYGYNTAPNYGAYGAVSYSSLPQATASASSAANVPNEIATVSYDTDDMKGDTAALNIQLPANASLFFNDVATTGQVGARMRRYVTPTLSPGETYKFVLRAEWLEGGKMVERSREVKVEAGNVINVDFVPPAS
jgi:uncharacterized protein (TIGR03000 family)